MLVRRMLAALCCSLLLPMVAAAQGYAPPSAEVVDGLRQHHHAKDVWRITTDSTRYDVHVGSISVLGLGTFKSREAQPPPDRIRWEAIARIDARESEKGSGRLVGMVLGGVVGVKLLPKDWGGGTLIVFSVLDIAAGWAGARLGARSTSNRELYVAVPATAAPAFAVARPVAVADTTVTDSAIAIACARVTPYTRLRIEGDFGQFTGYAGTCTPAGLSQLRAIWARDPVPGPEPLGWERIELMELRGNRAGRGAARGAMAFGVTAGLLGFVVHGILGEEHASWGAPETVAVSALSGAALGGLLGGAAGAGKSTWTELYRRP